MEKIEILRSSFRSGITRSLAFRKKQLKSIFRMLDEHENDFCDALLKDMNKPRLESIALELLMCKQEASVFLKNMDGWLVNEKVPRSFLTIIDSLWIQRQPFGVAMCIGAWNYPFFITLVPLCGLLAAGNCVLLKPSEVATHSEQLLLDLLPKFVDQNVCQVVHADGPGTAALLKERFDLIVFTGSSTVGKLVMEAASKHLTPVVLELGGKCPAYVDKKVKLKMTVKRIIWSKFSCAGQTCVAPDYVLCHRDIKEEFIKACAEVMESFYSAVPSSSPDYPHIINNKNYNRLMDMIKQTRGKIVKGGNGKEDILYIDPTLVELDSVEDILMKSEIFGPILPVITVSSPDQALDIINNGEKPLALYLFTNHRSLMTKFEMETSSGGLVFNDCVVHVGVKGLPFGGVGNSGMGFHHGKFSIDQFSHHRAVLDKNTIEMLNNTWRYPPFNESKEKWARWGLKSDASERSRVCRIL